MTNQELLIKAIRNKLSKEISLIDEVASVLNISYDAAHRRVSMKSKFSIEEAIELCSHYGFSLDNLFKKNNSVLIEKTSEITSFDDLTEYFKQSVHHLKKYQNLDNVTLTYSAKDIPLFYTIDGTLLSKFKIYVWMNLLIGTENLESFDKFQLPAAIQQYTEILRNIHTKANVIEIWNDTTINSTLQQIVYFYESGLINLTNTDQLFADLYKILNAVEEKSSKNKSNFHLYYNEIIILNNNVLVSNEHKKTLFIPYTLLGYFITEDTQTCLNAELYFNFQTQNSKSLNLSGVRDRKIFFNKAHQKIAFYENKIKNDIEITN
jgi:hypothetical protein